MDDSPQPDALSTYRAKRSPDSSPEPVGTVSAVPGHLFVVHKHAARQLHFDLRLEMDGVLRSWAVPRGPSNDIADKRLAVRVEDHPLEYGDFEGTIPQGNYGAGGVIVWDRGEWVPLEDWREGLEKGKLLFELKGYKLRGKWTLVKIKKSDKDWLFIKERDAWMKQPAEPYPEESVLSGLTVDEVKAGQSPTAAITKLLEERGATRASVDPRKVQLMLAETSDRAFTRDGWLFELKLDGYRILASKAAGEALLLTRNGNDYTEVFPEVARAVKALPFDQCIVDGEVVVLDANGRPSFSLLQRRGKLTAPLEVKKAAVEFPVTYFAFDLLALEGFDVRPLALPQRKEILQKALPKLGPVRYLDHFEREGEALMTQVTTMGLEGIIAKEAAVPYKGGRTSHWLKIKAEKTGDFVIVGFTAPKGGRGHIGALQLADYVNGALVYAGRVGTGFSDELLGELREAFEPLLRDDPPCFGPLLADATEPLASEKIPETKTTSWVEPRLVCEVRYREWTPDGLLRHSAFLRMREDKRPEDCERQHRHAPVAAQETPDPRGQASLSVEPSAPNRQQPPAQKTIAFSNLKKIYWPDEKYTKGDLIEYYRTISPWLLPYLKNRPVVMTRYPDGIDGKSFYQKDAPEFAPEWIPTVGIWSNDTQREIRYFVCDSEEALLYIANLGSIPLHIWMSRVGSLETPDWCVIDLDPKEAPFKDVVAAALVLHSLCDGAGLPNYVKTTGKTGLHIMLPLGRQVTYEQSRMLGELLARLVMKELKDTTTITRHVTKRGDKVYIDYLQNRHGQLIVAPYSVRPLPGATVSMPLEWSEVNDALDPRNYTIKNAVERMQRLGNDPVLPVLEQRVDLGSVLQKLANV